MAAATGIETTLRTLLRSTNPAATDLLVVALGSSSSALRVGAVRALALRDDPKGHRQLVEQAAKLPGDAQAALADSGRETPLTESLANWIAPATPKLARRAADVALRCRSTSLLPKLVDAVQWAGDRDLSAYAEAVLRLAEDLEQDLRDHDPRVTRRDARPAGPDPAFARRAAVNALASALETFGSHRRRELIDALLLLTPSDEPALLRTLRTQGHPARETLLLALRTCRTRGAIGVLARAMADTRSPQFLLDIAADRSDLSSLKGLLQQIGYPIGLRVRDNCDRIDGFAWLEPAERGVVLELPGHAQAAAIQLAAASKASRRKLVALIDLLLVDGEPEGKLAACKAIEHLPDHLAFEPLSRAIDSNDPVITGAAAKLLRKKDFPQATGKLVALLDHANDEVRSTAQASLKELSFATFRDNLEELDPATRQAAGELVGKADPLAASSLRAELKSGAVARRLRALDLVETMRLAEQLTDELIAAVSDSDTGVRCEAVRLLASVEPTPAVIDAFVTAYGDASPEVRLAAEAILLRLQGEAATAPNTTLQGKP